MSSQDSSSELIPPTPFQPTDGEVEVLHENDSDNPHIATVPICNGCESTDFPGGNRSSLGNENEHVVVVIHVCSECGVLSATEVPKWKQIADSGLYIAVSSEGALVYESESGRLVGPGDRWAALGQLGYSRNDVKAMFNENSEKTEAGA